MKTTKTIEPNLTLTLFSGILFLSTSVQEDAVFVERKAYEAALAAMRYSHVVMLLIDGREGMVTRTELSIANEVLRQGRALVVAVNVTSLLLLRSNAMK